MTLLPSWRSVGRLLIGVLICTQLAIAAHACSGVSRMDMPARPQAADALSAAAMAETGPGGHVSPESGAAAGQGDGMDPALSNLCVTHCQYAPLSADHARASVMPAMVVSYLYTLPPIGEPLEASEASHGPDRPFAAAGPPHAILHCCLRN